MKKIFSAALALVCIWFATPSFANCNLLNPDTITSATVTIPVEYGKTYVWSYDKTNYDFRWDSRAVYGVDSNNELVDGGVALSPNGSASYNATSYFVIQIINPSVVAVQTIFRAASIQPTIESIKNSKMMFEEGSTATPYQPYDANCVDPCANMFNMDWLLNADGWTKNGGVYTGANGTQYGYAKNGYPITFAPNTQYIITGHVGNNPGSGRFEVVYTDDTTGTIRVENTDFFAKTYPGKNVKSLRFNYANTGVMEVSNIQVKPAYCSEITIATTKYNETKFSPLNTALANAISVVDSVVSNTITQAASIATLQTQKQTRPNDIADDNEKCPAGKKCLLVEDASGTPHWYEIVENAWSTDYTVLQYISSSGTQWIDTGYVLQSDDITFEWTAIDRADGNSSLFGSEVYSTPKYSIILYGSQTSRALYIANTSALSVGYASRDSNFHSWVLSVTSDHKVTLSKDGVRVGGGDWIGDIQKQRSIGIFENNNQHQIASLTLKSFSITDGGVLVRNMIPMKRKIDDAVGLYDTVNNRFYTNVGDGEFTAGPVAE